MGSSVSPELEKVRIEAEVHRLVTARDKKYTNFIEYNNYKLIYRRYAGLFFTIAVDTYDNELSYLETIHLFVELLDSYFSNGKYSTKYHPFQFLFCVRFLKAYCTSIL